MDENEKTLTRSEGRWSDLYVTILRPRVVFTARINQTFESLDGVAEITFDDPLGDLAEVLPNMTVKIGSSAGGMEIGCARVRKASIESTKLLIGQTAELALENDQYLTVIEDFGLWAKLPAGSGAQIMLDYDVEFEANQANAPVPVLGSMVTVLRLSGASVSHTRDAAESYSPIGAEIVSYEWFAPGAEATTGMDTATPTITYVEDGEYLEYCKITDENGAWSVGYRKTLVNPPAAVVDERDLELGADVDEGGGSLSFMGVDGVGPDELDDRSMVVLWTSDHLGSEEMVLGPLPGAENILFVGWVEGQTINWGPRLTTVDFTAHGPAWWLAQISGAAIGLTNTASAATTWEEVENLTVDQVLYRLLHWYSTVTGIMDVYLTGDTKVIPFANLPSGMLWEQLKNYAEQTLIAFPQVDEYGRLWVEIPSSLLPEAERAEVPVLIDLTSADLTGQVEIQRRNVHEKGMIELSGTEAGGAIELYSRAPGQNAARYGGPDNPYTTLVFANQADCNRLTGAYRAWKNNEFPSVVIPLKYDLRHLALCPRSIIRLTMAASDNPLGLVWTNKRLVPIAYSREYDGKSGALLMTVTCEAETSGAPGVTHYPPAVVDIPFEPPDVPAPPIIVPPPYPPVIPPVGPVIPENVQPCSVVDVPNGPIGLTWDKAELRADGSLSTKAACKCKIRANSAVLYPTQLQVNLLAFGALTGKLSCYGISANGTRVVTGTQVGNLFTFAPATATQIAGFELVLSPNYFQLGDFVTEGTVNATSSAGATIPVTPGQYYAIQGAGGPWLAESDKPSRLSYTFIYSVDGSVWSGNGVSTGIGWSNYNTYPDYTYYDTYGDLGGEQVDDKYGRAFFLASEVNMKFRVSASNFADNAGTMGYKLYTALPGKVVLGASQCWNVCV